MKVEWLIWHKFDDTVFKGYPRQNLSMFCCVMIGHQDLKVAVIGRLLFSCYFPSVYCLSKFVVGGRPSKTRILQGWKHHTVEPP